MTQSPDTTPSSIKKLRVAVLISGRGSNLAALIEACSAPDYPAEIVLVISNQENAGGINFAKQAGIPVKTIRHKDYPAREEFDAALTSALEVENVELVCLAGFMRILTRGFVNHWQNRLINIHPSLLPAYKGLDVHRRMIDDKIKMAGCTVHYVTAEMDAGPVIGQRPVPVMEGDTADDLAARILVAEHLLYAESIKKIAEEKIQSSS